MSVLTCIYSSSSSIKSIKLRSSRTMDSRCSNTSFSSRLPLMMRERRWKWRRRENMEYSYSSRWLNSNRNRNLLNQIKEGEEEEVLSHIKHLNKIQANCSNSNSNSNKIGSSTINNLLSNFKTHHNLPLSPSTGSNSLRFNNKHLQWCISSKCRCNLRHNSNSLSSTIKSNRCTLLKWCHNRTYNSNSRQFCNSHHTHPTTF